jgi:hypothetical protein
MSSASVFAFIFVGSSVTLFSVPGNTALTRSGRKQSAGMGLGAWRGALAALAASLAFCAFPFIAIIPRIPQLETGVVDAHGGERPQNVLADETRQRASLRCYKHRGENKRGAGKAPQVWREWRASCGHLDDKVSGWETCAMNASANLGTTWEQNPRS